MEDNAMKKVYMKPSMHIVKIQQTHIICTSPGSGAHGDDPQNPGGAMSRRFDGWDDEDW